MGGGGLNQEYFVHEVLLFPQGDLQDVHLEAEEEHEDQPPGCSQHPARQTTLTLTAGRPQW